MQTITIQINNSSAIKTIEMLAGKHAISIIERSSVDSPSLPGQPMSISAFKKWIEIAENSKTISLDEAKAQWAKKKKQLQQIIK